MAFCHFAFPGEFGRTIAAARRFVHSTRRAAPRLASHGEMLYGFSKVELQYGVLPNKIAFLPSPLPACLCAPLFYSSSSMPKMLSLFHDPSLSTDDSYPRNQMILCRMYSRYTYTKIPASFQSPPPSRIAVLLTSSSVSRD